MTKDEFKDGLVEMGYAESVIFETPDYFDAIIGFDDSTGAVIYDFDGWFSTWWTTTEWRSWTRSSL